MSEKILINDLPARQKQLLEKLELPSHLLSRIKNATQEQADTIRDVLSLIYPTPGEKDYGARALTAINVSVLQTVIEDILKNFNHEANFYHKDYSNMSKMVTALTKVMATQTNLMKELKSLSLIGAPNLHVHHHARGVPKFKDGTVIVIGEDRSGD